MCGWELVFKVRRLASLSRSALGGHSDGVMVGGGTRQVMN